MKIQKKSNPGRRSFLKTARLGMDELRLSPTIFSMIHGHRTTMRHVASAILLAGLLFCGLASAADGRETPKAAKALAREIIEKAGVHGGLIVHLGCGDQPELTAALRLSESFVVQGLETDAEKVFKARKFIQDAGLYGPVSVIEYDGKTLPYVDKLVNLVIAPAVMEKNRLEIERVLAPGGTAVFLNPQAKITHRKWKKPWPTVIDQWTHYFHDAGGNAVGEDTGYGLPRGFQWMDGPKYARHHEKMASTSAMVTSSGRLFYIQDEGSIAWNMFPAQWRLVARDAFSGVRLWSHEIEKWWSHFHPLKHTPATLARRLVAEPERDLLFVTLGIDAPVSVLDAATGKTIGNLSGTDGAEEIIVSAGVVVCSGRTDAPLVGADEFGGEELVADIFKKDNLRAIWGVGERWINAYDVVTRQPLWEMRTVLQALSQVSDGTHLYFYDGQCVQALNLRTGEPLWRSVPLPACPQNFSWSGPNMVVHKDIVLFSGGKDDPKYKTRALWPTADESRLFALDAASGKVLWEGVHPRGGHGSLRDLLVIDDHVYLPKTGEHNSGPIYAYHYRTGLEVDTISKNTEFRLWAHQRCHMQRAVGSKLLLSMQGIEVVDLENPKSEWIVNNWLRGSCYFGFIPSYGMYFVPPHPCACWLDAKLDGLFAMTPPRAKSAGYYEPNNGAESRLHIGPAYANISKSPIRNQQSDDWPTYRADNLRSGRSASPIAISKPNPLWQSQMGGVPTPPVIANGQVYAAIPEQHAVVCLDANSGKQLWRFTANARIDSPPTIHGQGVYFGCRDGRVYCLDAQSGNLAWSFQVAPDRQSIMVENQLESLWPVHGSVLIRENKLYAVAGRSIFVDGGLRMVILDPADGRLIAEHSYDDMDPESGKNIQFLVALHTLSPTGLPDILSADDQYLYMRTQAITPDGMRVDIRPVLAANPGPESIIQPHLIERASRPEYKHLFSPTGFLDDTWWHRTYWTYGNAWVSGALGWYRMAGVGPSGRILCLDHATGKAYGYGRYHDRYGWIEPVKYRLFKSDMHPSIQSEKVKGFRNTTNFSYDWEMETPIHVRAMALAGDTIVAAGSPAWKDDRPPADSHATDWRLPQMETMEAQAAWHGERGGKLILVSTKDGVILHEFKIDALPVFDGLAIAEGRVFVSMRDGSIRCFGE